MHVVFEIEGEWSRIYDADSKKLTKEQFKNMNQGGTLL